MKKIEVLPCPTRSMGAGTAEPLYICLFFSTLKLEPEILQCQIFSAVLSRTTNTLSLFYQIATSSSTIIAFEELNAEGSDTVFHA